MISSITVNKQLKSLVPFNWQNIPPLVTIAGANGAGKTELLNQIYQVIDMGMMPGDGGPMDIVTKPQIIGRVLQVPVGFLPERLAQPNTDPRQQSEANAARVLTYIRQGNWNNVRMNDIALEAFTRAGHPYETIKDVNKAEIAKLTDNEIIECLPRDFALMMNNFQNNEYISEVCISYFSALNSFKISNYGREKLSDKQIYDELGFKPPWLVINNLFEKYGFSYILSEPALGAKYIPRFLDRFSGNSIQFSGLSSGEKILVTFILWAYNSRQKLHTSVFLLDEIDAHLNPSLSKMMMEIILDKLVGEYGLQVIMTTHSPSTIAYTPDENIFWMERGAPIRQSSKAEVIPLLSDGFITVQSDKALEIFGMVMEKDTKPILCVEGITDKAILNEAWNRLHKDTPMPFQMYDVFDCHFLTNLFKRGEIFDNYKKHSFIGLLDFDEAFIDARRKLKKDKWAEKVDKKNNIVSFNHKSEKGVLLTLPVPSFRADYAGPEIKNSYLSIELLFEDKFIEKYCDTAKVAGGTELKRFKDKKKTEFSNEVKTLEDNAFAAFKPLFDTLTELSKT